MQTNDTFGKLGMMIGLCTKAGAAVCGTALACDAVRYKKANTLLLACNASDNTKKKVRNCALYYKADVIYLPLSTEALGRYCGKGSSVGCIAITDVNFITAINNILSR